jgi:hypothetical protein
MAQRDPNYNLNALNPKGVINSLKTLQRERAANYGKVVHDFGNGWTMRKLRNKEEAEWEGAQMANCIADYGDDIQMDRRTSGRCVTRRTSQRCLLR